MRPLEALTASLLDAVKRGAHADAVVLTFLLRRYAATDAPELGAAVGAALASALDDYTQHDTTEARAAWLTLFADAHTLSDDERLRGAADRLLRALLADAGASPSIAAAAAAIDACLRAADCGDRVAIVRAAIDQLENVVGRSYRPGEGLGPALADHVSAAAALLTAFHVTDRLPYAMLAEELVRTARRRAWDEDVGAFGVTREPENGLDVNCDAARVLCRLAALHGDAAYRAAAVIAPDADYRRDAARILAHVEPAIDSGPAAAARYGIALAEYLDLQ
jgi:uncharacterized protein YyaL (SSP411 family)